jgi:hypothetical protein
VKVDPRSGQSKTQRADGNVDRLRTFVSPDGRLALKLMAEELNMNRETVRQIIMEDFGMRKFFAKMVPRILTDDHKRRLYISSDLLHNADMFDRISTGDETWCFQYDPETKHRIHLG